MFDVCRQITALEAAQRIGLPLEQKGRRYWTCCPLHYERTPSMMFDEHGRWHCFGCNTGGDAVALYAAYFNERPIVAARRLASEFGLSDLSQSRKPVQRVFHVAQEEARNENEEEHRLCLIKHTAEAVKACSTGDIFWEAVGLEADATIALLNIDAGDEYSRLCARSIKNSK